MQNGHLETSLHVVEPSCFNWQLAMGRLDRGSTTLSPWYTSVANGFWSRNCVGGWWGPEYPAPFSKLRRKDRPIQDTNRSTPRWGSKILKKMPGSTSNLNRSFYIYLVLKLGSFLNKQIVSTFQYDKKYLIITFL